MHINIAQGGSVEQVNPAQKLRLPEPEAQISDITSPLKASADIPWSTSTLPKFYEYL